jgi:hypothetical protein
MLDSLKFWIGFFVLAAAIVVVGWREPLRYRFMSSEEIELVKHPATPMPAESSLRPKGTPWHLNPNRKTLLDGGAYNQAGGGGGSRGGNSGMSRGGH